MKTLSARRSPNAFTLIELLVVIAIIALLAAILFPVFGRARENARRSTCQSNLKNIGLGVLQYAQDYDEGLPLRTGGGGGNSWDDSVNPYMKSRQVYQCPSDSVVRTSTATLPRTYAFNCDDVGSNPPFGVRPMNFQNVLTRLPAIPDTSGTIMVTERPSTGGRFGQISFSEVKTPAGSNQQLDLTMIDAPLHFDGWNYLFCDGHVKWLLPAKTVGTGSQTAPKGMWTVTEND